MIIRPHTWRNRRNCRTCRTNVKFIPVSSANQIETVESLAKEIWSEHYTAIIGRNQVEYMLDRFQSKKAISDQIREGVLYFLMDAGSQSIGYLAVEPKGCELFLGKIYVRSSSRMRGFGKEALLFIEGLARKRGLEKISLTVNRNNSGSIKAYERLGFKNCGPVVQDIGGGFVMDDYRMEKIVSCPVQEDK